MAEKTYNQQETERARRSGAITSATTDYPAHALPSDAIEPPEGARQNPRMGVVSELPSLFGGEHSDGDSSLPETVSAAEILAQQQAKWGKGETQR
ncbi:hypothetical protein SBA1_1030043 [Candidatus Sulfotelmatobacter kueseliae]|uniref:Uncharacterized protein n=1 Tax=Candidatus Sulfotelmatobacter kueseliae TaxID=2042962 RepID=A0A2U3JXN4_9BACT|nr:hypothetical protein SBA1_1030043 [Candidatus Sulfotelmatobacter kueseliae]